MGTIAEVGIDLVMVGASLSLPARKAAEVLLVQLHKRETSATIISTRKEDEAL